MRATFSCQMAGGVPVVTLPTEAGAEPRSCEQCGAVFTPRREHARFCGAGCRAAWNRGHAGDPAVEMSALTWSVTAMSEVTGRLPDVQARDQRRAFAVVGEAVWWITMIDATLVRRHPGVYDTIMAAQPPAEQVMIQQTLAGLRFVRNWIGRRPDLGGLVDAGRTGAPVRPITAWRWKHVSPPALASLPPHRQAWERARYRAYQAHLAGRTIGEVFGRAAAFLELTATRAVPATYTAPPAAP
jgi:hypothetical protein